MKSSIGLTAILFAVTTFSIPAFAYDPVSGLLRTTGDAVYHVGAGTVNAAGAVANGTVRATRDVAHGTARAFHHKARHVRHVRHVRN